MIAIIANPASGEGKRSEIVPAICAVLERRGLAYRIYETQCAGDGAQKTRQALEEGCKQVICVGGDGTLSEVVGPLAASEAELIIVPGGTGNDFARTLRLPKEPFAALEAQLDGVSARIDCASINGKPFINVAGSGFDVAVLQKTEELKKTYPGEKAYRKAVLAVLGRYDAFEAKLSIDGGEEQDVRATIVEIANGRYIGGGMLVAPDASVTDGLFDVMIVDMVPRKLIPLLLPLFIKGWHKYLPVARRVRARRVVMRAEGMVVNIDGNLSAMDRAEFEIMPGALRVRLPQNG